MNLSSYPLFMEWRESLYRVAVITFKHIIIISENLVIYIRICSCTDNLCLHSPRLLGIFYKFFFNKRSFFYKVLLETLLFSVEIWSNDSIIEG